jgi:hydroxypyruvate isomerase
MSDGKVTRRSALGGALGAAGALAAGVAVSAGAEQPAAPPKRGLKQSVCRWCYGGMPLEELARNAAAMGLKSIELLGPDEWPVVKKHGLTCAMANGPSGIVDGWNRVEDHDRLVKESERLLPLVAAAGLPSMIVFSGNRRGISDADGLKNCARGLKRITPLAERLGVTVCMELLNSKRDHGDYQCDRTPWGVELVKQVGSDRFKLLYDIYHMQIMEGDVVQTIVDNIQHIGHFHTGGVPGRNEIDETQELFYPRIVRAILDAGFKGYFAHEFIPRRDPMKSLRAAKEMCDL